LEKIKYYITKLLTRSQGCHFYKTDIELFEVIGTHGNVGFYVKYSIVDHFTGYVWLLPYTVFIPNKKILDECRYQSRFGGTILHAERRTKLNLIELKRELNVL